MSPIGARVAARLASTRQAGDVTALLVPEAATDALALLREAAPAPTEEVDDAALADVCMTFFLRGQAAGEAIGPDLVVAGMVGGFLFEREPRLVPDALRAHLASVRDPLREARFAYAAAMAHADAVMSGAGEPAALDRALLWSAIACQATADRGDAAEAADAAVQRMGLLTARFQLAADLDALAEAARDGMTVLERLSPENPEQAVYLPPIAEAIVRSALMLGSPPADEAERVVAVLAPGTATEATTQMLGMLRACHADPVTWPGELDARVGLVLTTEGAQAGHAGLLAAAVRRLRAALAVTPREHPGHPQLSNALGAALVSFGEQRGETGAVQEGLTLLGQGGHLFRLLADQLSGPGVPAETGAAAAVVDLMTSAAGGETVALTSEWRAEFAATVERLPERHPHRPVYATLLAAVTNEPGRTATAVLIAAAKIDWPRLAAELRAAGPADQPATALADGFEMVAGNLGGLDGIAALLDSIGTAESDDDRDAVVEQIGGVLAADNDALSADMRAGLSGLLGLLTAQRGATTGDPAALRDLVQAMVHSQQAAGDPASDVTDGLGLTVALSMLAGPQLTDNWDQETRLAAAALLAARQQKGGEPRIEDAFAALGEMMMAGTAFSAESEVSQLDKFRDVGQRIIAMAGQLNPALGEQMTVLLDTVLNGMTGMAQTLEAIPQNRAAESHAGTIAEARQRIHELPPEHPMRGALHQLLAVLLAGQAFYLRDTDPEQARELLAEATALADLEHAIEPIATVLRQYLGHTREALEQTESPPPPGLRPGTSTQEVRDRLRQAGNSPEVVREVLADQKIPVWARVNAGFSTAFRLTGDLRVEEGLDCAEQAVDLLAAITDRGVDSVSAEHAIASLVGGMPATYVSAMLGMLHGLSNGPTQTGPLVDRAAVLAERSRGLLLARQLEGRTDLGELRSAHPERADEFDALTGQLAASPDALAALRPGDNPPAAGRAEWARLVKFRASRELDMLIARIRAADDDFRDFMRPLTADQLRGLAAEGPVVMLTYPTMAPTQGADAPDRPFALVVTGQAITSVRLEVRPAEVADVAHRWTEAIAIVNSRGAERPGLAELRRAAAAVTEILSWTWHHVTGPVLAAAELPSPADWPRIWWIPDGPFHALPLHAAQCPGCELGAGCGAALDAVVSSYVPGFRTLAHARRRAAGSEADVGRALIVAATEDELPGAEAAARVAAERLGAGKPLTGTAATRAAVTEALAEANVAHFGCHAASDPAEPSGGVLYLPGGEQLTVREICQARPRAARLAFLTACSTARTSQRLAGEAIHLSSAFLVAGFGAAVGTLWEIDSQDAYRVTTQFYQRITGRPPQDGAVALHHCVRALRHERPGAPHIWAAYVHAGA